MGLFNRNAFLRSKVLIALSIVIHPSQTTQLFLTKNNCSLKNFTQKSIIFELAKRILYIIFTQITELNIMKPIKLLNTITTAIMLLLCLSCSQDTQKVTYNIPQTLQNNQEAVTIIEEMVTNVQKLNEGMAASIQTTLKIKNTADQGTSATEIDKMLSVWRMTNTVSSVNEMAKANKNIKILQARAILLKQKLEPEQISALDTTLAHIKAQVGNINPETLGLSDEALAKLQKDGQLDIKVQVGDAEILANQELHTKGSSNTPGWIVDISIFLSTALFMILKFTPLIIFIIFIVKIVKHFKNRNKHFTDSYKRDSLDEYDQYKS